MDRAELKRQARASLGGKLFGPVWLHAVLTVLVASLLTGVAGTMTTSNYQRMPYLITVSLNLLVLILGGPISYGLARMFMQQSRDGQPMKLKELFQGFREDFKGLFLLNLMQNLFIVLWTLLFILPGIVAELSYSMSYFVKVDHPEYNWSQCISESKRLMSGHKGELFVLQLSFLGWILVGILCLGVGTLWVSAYAYATTALYYQHLKTIRPTDEEYYPA